jgi:hypothetical protein
MIMSKPLSMVSKKKCPEIDHRLIFHAYIVPNPDGIHGKDFKFDRLVSRTFICFDSRDHPLTTYAITMATMFHRVSVFLPF